MAILILLALFAVAVLIGAIYGLVRGLNKAVIRLMTLVVAVLLTFLIAGPVTTLVAESITIEGMSLGQLILENVNADGSMDMIFAAAPLLREAILVVPAFAISLVVFPVVFGVLKFITWIVFLFVQKPLRKLIFKDNCNKEEYAAQPKGVRVGKRFAGMGVGIVTGVLIFGMIVTPVFGVFGMLPAADSMNKMLDTMVQQDAMSAEDAALVKEIYGVTDNGLVSFYNFFGAKTFGKAYINSVTTMKVDGYTTSLGNELGSLLSTVQTVMESGLLSKLEDPNFIYTLIEDKDALASLLQSLAQSQILCSAVPDLMASAVESAAVGMNMPTDKGVVYDNMMEFVANAIKNAEIDYAALKAYEDATGTSFALQRLSTASKAGAIMSEAEYEAEVQKLVVLAKSISSALNRALSGNNATFTDSVAIHIINEVKAEAAENGQDAIANFDASSVQNAISSANAADIDVGEGDAAKLLEQLTNKEKFETDVATVNALTESIRESMKNAFADESTAAQTANTLASVVSDFVAAVSTATDDSGNIDITKVNFDKIANAVTSLQKSPLKEVGTLVLDIVASADMGDNNMLSDVIGAVKEGYEEDEDVGGTIGTAGALIGLGAAMSDPEGGNEEAIVNSLTSLINNLNEFTIGLLPTIFSDETVASMGIPQEYAEATYGVIETLLKELMKLKDAQDYDNEVKAILSLYNLATTGVENFTEDNIIDLFGHAMQSDAIFNTLVSVSESNPFGIEIPDAASRAEVANTIEQIYAESGKTQREKDVANAIAVLLGVEEELNLA